MTVYVDDAYIPAKVGRHTSHWCHLFSDTSDEELHAFADRLGLRRSYFQLPDARLQTLRHYDLTRGMRFKAVSLGATEITVREAGRLMNLEHERLQQAKKASPAPSAAQEPT